MYFSDICNLIKVEPITDTETGNTKTVETKKEVYCNKKSISQTEHYQAAAVGFKPQLKLEVMTFEYDEESILEFENKRYKIERTFEAKNEITELICVGNNIDNEIING